MTSKEKWVVSLFDFTGNMVKPWLEQRYPCLIVDMQHEEGLTQCYSDNLLWKMGGDIREKADFLYRFVSRNDIQIVFGFPPCTDLAGSGARWWKEKAKKNPQFQQEALELVKLAAEIGQASGAPWMVENPVGVISKMWRKWDHTFHPYQYTQFCTKDNYTKKTCLWTGNGFVMPPEARDETLGAPDDRIHKAGPGEGRQNFRSATPMGFARAVFEANKEQEF